MRFSRLLRGIENLETGGIFVVHQTRIADERLGASPKLHYVLEIAEIPGGDFRCRPTCPRELGELLSGLLAQLGAQLGEVATGRELPAVLVDDAEIHRKMCGQHFLPESIERNGEVQLAARVARDGLRKRCIRALVRSKERVDELG